MLMVMTGEGGGDHSTGGGMVVWIQNRDNERVKDRLARRQKRSRKQRNRMRWLGGEIKLRDIGWEEEKDNRRGRRIR